MKDNNIFYKLSYKIVKQYCENILKYKILEIANRNSEAHFDVKTIIINSNLLYENAFYVLLHEAGHVLFKNSKEYKELCLDLYYCKQDSTYWKVNRLYEEYAAWKKGLKLAKRLHIYVNRRRFNNFKSQCLLSHAKYSINT